MAAKAAAKPKPELRTVETSTVKRFAARIGGSKQEMDDARMELAGIYKDAEDEGLNRWALKQAIAFSKMDIHKAKERLIALAEYLPELGVLAEQPDLVFAQMDLEDVEPAA
jgi:uncharacterized protein (UPF0335 family)